MGEAATKADHYYRVMTETRGAHTDGTGATEDIQRLQDRIRELEQQLASRDAVAAKAIDHRQSDHHQWW